MEHDVTIRGNTITNTYGVCIAGGIEGGLIANNVLTGQRIEDGIQIGGMTPYNTHDLTIQGNTIGNVGFGIHFDRGPSPLLTHSINISGNVIHDCMVGLQLASTARAISIVGNVIRNSNFDDLVSGAGIALNDAVGVLIANNYIYDDRDTPIQPVGIAVSDSLGTLDNLVLSGNVITNMTTNGVMIYARQQSDSYERVVIQGNLVVDNFSKGIELSQGMQGVLLLGNVTRGHSNDIRVLTAEHTIVGSNNLFDTYWADWPEHPIDLRHHRARITFATAAPTSGTWAVGDRCYNTSPTAAGYVGWVCVGPGTPGTWKGFGAIQS